MRVDVVTIFPAHLSTPALSLPGKARDRGRSTCACTTCGSGPTPHRTVDDTPYGAFPGMVMKPEPWGEALDALAGPVHDGRGAPRRPGGRSRSGWPGELATLGAPAGGLRALRGHRPARAGPCRVPSRTGGARGLAGRDDASSTEARSPPVVLVEAVRACRRASSGQRGLAGRGVAPRTALAPADTKPLLPAWPGRAPAASVGRPCPDRRLAPRPVGRAHGGAPSRPAAPLAGPRRLRGPPRRARPIAGEPLDAPPGVLGAGAARQPGGARPPLLRTPTTTSRWPTSRPGSRTTRCWSCAARSGWSRRRARPRAGRVGHRPADGRSRPAGPRPRALAPRADPAGRGAAGRDDVQPRHRPPLDPQPASVQEGRLPAPRPPQHPMNPASSGSPNPARPPRNLYMSLTIGPQTRLGERVRLSGTIPNFRPGGGGSGRLAPRSSRSKLQLVCVPYELLADVENPQSGYSLPGFDQLTWLAKRCRLECRPCSR